MTDDERRAIEADCQRLINLYVNLSDAQKWEELVALYTPDARFARPSKPDEFVEGRAAILEGFTARPARAQRHVIANTVVGVVDADHATAFSVIVLYLGEAAEPGELPAMSAKSPLVGTFTDKLVRTADGWRFAERIGGLDFRP
ncbi:nuclear transport factor 2 family protein [Altererythrobacter indicus]|uniref:Nuclear transport factor 2 family protein n=1 Tax=Altericroceibacterium indicum TaxID=374177 RepID=A0A845AB65_9SPHN|nr:nuclear transport factor 2 family protein [Altericroceibacterium indicum]